MIMQLTAAGVWLAAGAAGVRPDDVESLVARLRERAGIVAAEANPGGVQLTGTTRLFGHPRPYTLTLNSSGAFAEESGGDVPLSRAFDGAQAWMLDLGGEARTLELGERDDAILSAWAVTGGWLAPRAPVTISGDAPASDGSPALRVRIDGSPIAARVEIDPATGLARKWEYQEGSTARTITLRGVVELDGGSFPAEVERSSPQGDQVSILIAAARPAPAFLRSPYEALRSPPSDARFDPDAPADLEIRKAPTGHLLVRPRVDGRDVGWFIFDTGAGAGVLADTTIAQLGLAPFGEIPASGIGGVVKSPLVRPASLTLGPLTMDRPLMIGLDLAFLEPHMGVPIAGVVGYNLIFRCVARIDMAEGLVSLHDPASFEGEGLPWQRLILHNRVPTVEAAIEEHEGLFRLDTGAGSTTLIVHGPAVERLKLLEDRETALAMTGGVGGMKAARSGVLKSVRIGGHRFEDVKATFAAETRGPLGDPYTLGVLGGGLLRDLRIVSDYQRERIAFIPR